MILMIFRYIVQPENIYISIVYQIYDRARVLKSLIGLISYFWACNDYIFCYYRCRNDQYHLLILRVVAILQKLKKNFQNIIFLKNRL
jgi:hypothetical protein